MQYANLASVIVELQNSAAQPVRALAPQASQAFAQLSVGQAVTATIVSQLSAGLYLADIADQRLQLTLPIAVSPGDALTLRLLRQQPQLGFELLSLTAGAQHPASASIASGSFVAAEFADARSAPAAGAAASQALSQPQTSSQLIVGQTVTATVIAKLATGLSLTDIGGQRMQLELPATVAPGDSVTLRLLELEPQPSFELLAHLPAATTALPPVLSTGAQLIQAVLTDTTTAPALTKVAAPLVAAAPAAPEPLAAALRAAIETSGLFYESHLAAWAQGQRPLAALRREPQALWNLPRGDAAGADSPLFAVQPEHASIAQALPEQAPAMLRQQLETLESQRILWAGQVWPGQEASLTIAEEAPEHSHGDSGADEAPAWRTSLAITLPQLGDIRAELVARGATLKIAITCGADPSAGLLKAKLPQLDERLRAAGLQPLELTVTGHG
jgi:hypothetical protein